MVGILWFLGKNELVFGIQVHFVCTSVKFGGWISE